MLHLVNKSTRKEASSNPVDEITSNDICSTNPSNFTANFPLDVASPHLSQTTSNTVFPSSESETTGSEEASPQFQTSYHKLKTNILLPILRIPLPQ